MEGDTPSTPLSYSREISFSKTDAFSTQGSTASYDTTPLARNIRFGSAVGLFVWVSSSNSILCVDFNSRLKKHSKLGF